MADVLWWSTGAGAPRTGPPPVVLGTTDLPPGFDHPHASEQARRIAERGTVLRAQVGSGVHGTAVAGQDDRDESGEVPLEDVLAHLAEAEAELTRLRTASHVPEQPDRAWVDGWLHRSCTSFWEQGTDRG